MTHRERLDDRGPYLGPGAGLLGLGAVAVAVPLRWGQLSAPTKYVLT